MTYQVKQPENASWIELNSDAFKNNVDIYRRVIGDDIQLGCVLKGNAYGHGFPEIVSLAYQNDLDVIFVINPFDGLYIREYEEKNNLPKKRVIVIGSIMPCEILKCVAHDIEISLGDEHFEYLNHFEILKDGFNTSKNLKLKIHLHIDTGLGREGVRVDHLSERLNFLKQYSDYFHLQGVMSHFANVEDVTEQNYAQIQLSMLEEAYSNVIEELNLNYKPEKHIAQSASTLILPNFKFDIVRVGMGLYGHWPSLETKLSAKVVLPKLPKLVPVLSWKIKSQIVKEMPEHSYIGYGCSYCTERNMRVAVLPVGYFDGYPRSLSNLGHMVVNGKRCKILGRVMMNYTIIDVTEAVADCTKPIEATIIGQDGQETITAEMLAGWADTIQYEILTRIGSHLAKVII